METKVIQNKTLGLTLNIEVPATVEAYDELAGEKDSCLNDAINQTLYQSWNSKFRREMCNEAGKKAGMEWPPAKVDENGEPSRRPNKADGSPGSIILMPEKKYFDILRTKIDPKELLDLAKTVASEIPFDPAPSRSTGPNKTQLNEAEQLFVAATAGGSSSPGSIEESCKTVTGKPLSDFGEVNWDDQETMVETLANMIRYDDLQQKQQRGAAKFG